MAIFHSSTQIISRSKGKSSIGASAYRSGEKIYNERDGLTHDYTKRKDVVYKEILVPSNAPSWASNREKLWNEVEEIEKRKDSQLAREINIALPKELDRNEQIELLKSYTQNTFVEKGMIADIVIHDKDNTNPHAHIMLTMREVNENGFGKKNREWNDRKYINIWREELANYINKALEEKGINERVDHRSYEEQGIEKIPTKHEGYVVREMEKRGVKTERGNLNREINDLNRQLELIEKQIKAQEGIKEVLYGLKDNGARNEDSRARTRDDEVEQGHRGYTIGSNNTNGSSVERLKQLAREKRERDRIHQERIDRENRERLERERQISINRENRVSIERGIEL